jgi:hypothetical protein
MKKKTWIKHWVGTAFDDSNATFTEHESRAEARDMYRYKMRTVQQTKQIGGSANYYELVFDEPVGKKIINR